MDKEEFRVKLEEINHLVEKKDYRSAMSVVDSIDWRRVKNVRTLCIVGEIYAANKRFEESKEIFLLAYRRAPIGKNILYRLVEISLKMNNVSEAEEFYEEYKDVAPNDNTCYVLNYKILKAKNAPLQEQIQVLEKYRELEEINEKWSYELAKLYYQADEKDKCLELCDEIILWFREGTYVMRAMDLKQRMGKLTGTQKEQYEAQFVPKLMKPEEAEALKAEGEEKEAAASEEKDHPEIESITMSNDRELGSIESFQEKISKGIRDIFGSRKDSVEDGEFIEKDDDEPEVQEEMIRDHSAEKEFANVPELEPETASAAEEDVASAEAAADMDIFAEPEEEETEAAVADTEETGAEDVVADTEETEAEAAVADTEETEAEAAVADTEETEAEAVVADTEETEAEAAVADTEETEAEAVVADTEETETEADTEEAEAVVVEKESEDNFTAELETSGELAAELSETAETENDSETAEEAEPELNEELSGFTSELEGAPEKKEQPAIELKMPKLEIPESMKASGNGEFEVPQAPVQSRLFTDVEDTEMQNTLSREFNLEDTILAAASAQGIEIPEEKSEPEAPEEKKEEAPVIQLEEEDFLSEEDLQEAEAEFLNGPAGKKPVEDEIPALEEEEHFAFESDADEYPEEEISDDDFITNMLKKSVKKASQKTEEPADEPVEQELLEETEEAVEPKKVMSEEEELERFIDSIQPTEERDPDAIIPREKELSEEERKLFTYFVKVPGMKEQLIDALYHAQMAAVDKTSRTGNIMVMGGSGSGKTRLIASLIPAICQELNMEAAKVAYVFADQLNEKEISRVVSKLSGGFLVIEEANQMTKETVELLDKAMEFRTDGLIVILEDEKIGMRKLIARFPKFAEKFSSIINIPVFTNDELVHFARVYTKENGFKIDQMGMLALYNQIGVNQKEDRPMSITAVKELLDNAMAKSQGGLLKFNKKKRVDRDGFMVLHEKDFSK